jgi:hypothetical protein
MAKIEDQRILVWCGSDENLQQTIVDAVYFALKLEKEVCLFASYTRDSEKNILENKVAVYSKVISKDIPVLKISTLVLKGELSKLMKELGETYNAILFCHGGKMTNQLLNAFYHSGFPFYFSKGSNNDENKFKKIIIPIDFRNSTKDSTLWGSYLGRFNNSEIFLLKAKEKDSDQKQQVDSIVAFVKKFYSQFFFNYWVTPGEKNSWGIHKEAIDKGAEYDLVIFTGSLYVTFADRLIGPFEKRLVNRSSTPVLLINPQIDLFVLCT